MFAPIGQVDGTLFEGPVVNAPPHTTNCRWFAGCGCSTANFCVPLSDLPNGWVPRKHTLTGYRVDTGWFGAIESIFSWRHNEFYNIWTDIVPVMVYVGLLLRFLFLKYTLIANGEQITWMKFGVFLGATICRLCSLFYHTFNSVNRWMSQRLLNVDLIGITFMTFVSPYFYYVGGPEGMDIYCSVLFCTQVVCIVMFASNLVFGESHISAALEQPLLFGLASVGNWSSIRLVFLGTVDIQQRIVSAVSLILLATGYAFCFINHWPEVFLPDGASDGKIWNSHVIWHGMLFVTQMLYLLSPVMLDCYFE